MKNQILLVALAIVAISFSAFTGKEKKSTLGVNTSESKVAWLGKKVTGEHSGVISVAFGDLQFEGDKLSGGSFEIDMKSIKNTDIENEEYNQKLVVLNECVSVGESSTTSTRAILKSPLNYNSICNLFNKVSNCTKQLVFTKRFG